MGPTDRQIQSWTLHINDDIQLVLSSAAQIIGGTDFVWFGEGFYDFEEDTVLEMSIKENDSDGASILLSSTTPIDEGDDYGGTYTVRLSRQPSDDVTVTVSGHEGTDVELSGLSAENTLTFTASNWHTPQTVMVKAGSDDDTTNDLVTLTHTAAGSEYAGVSADLEVTVTDDDTVPEDVGNAPTENTAATGRPTIAGTPAVGETLTADTSDIDDANGLTNATFLYQWSRDDGSTETDITGATSSTYTVHDDDVGYQLSVTVSFTDDEGYAESLTSEVGVRPVSPAPLRRLRFFNRAGEPRRVDRVHLPDPLQRRARAQLPERSRPYARRYQWRGNQRSAYG